MSFDKQLVDEVNELRSNPKKYADKISKYLDYFEGNVLKIPSRKAGIQTHEGPKAYKEAINYLSRQNPVEPLSPSKALFRIAKDYLSKIQRKNADTSSVDVDALIDKYGTYYGDLIHATDFGGLNPEEALIFLIVSDGDYNRRQRESLLSSSYKLIGGATGKHPMFQNCTVIFTCSEFENSKDAEDIGFLDGSSPSQPKIAAKPQPQAQTQSKYQPLSRSVQQPQTKYQPKYQPQAREQPQSKYQTKYQPQAREQPQTKYQSKYQPQEKERPQTKYQTKYQPQAREQPQTKYQSKYQPQEKEQPQTRYQPKYRSTRTQVETKTETQTRVQPQNRWSMKKNDDNNNAGGNKELKVISEKIQEKISIEGGKKIKETTITRIMSDGSKEVETMVSDS